MSLYPVLWAAEHAPIYDAEERAILVALTMKGDFDGANCFRSYGTLAKAARVDKKTAGRKCRAMESRGILRRQTEHLSQAWFKIPEMQRPVVWEVMIPAEWWSAAQLGEINEQRASLGRPPITAKTRPPIADAPTKTTRSDKGVKRPDPKKSKPHQTEEKTPGTLSPHPGDSQSPGDPGTLSPHPGDSQSPPRGLSVPQPSETPSESLSLSGGSGESDVTPAPEPETEERETGAARQQQMTGQDVAEAYVEQCRTARARVPGRRQLEQIAQDASDALASGDDPEWLLQQVVPFMIRRRYLDLGLARTHRECPPPRQVPEQREAPRRGPESDCTSCSGSGWAEDPSGEQDFVRCACVMVLA